jgi:hypothetical protein
MSSFPRLDASSPLFAGVGLFACVWIVVCLVVPRHARVRIRTLAWIGLRRLARRPTGSVSAPPVADTYESDDEEAPVTAECSDKKED